MLIAWGLACGLVALITLALCVLIEDAVAAVADGLGSLWKW
jgi:hypothetical protein